MGRFRAGSVMVGIVSGGCGGLLVPATARTGAEHGTWHRASACGMSEPSRPSERASSGPSEPGGERPWWMGAGRSQRMALSGPSGPGAKRSSANRRRAVSATASSPSGPAESTSGLSESALSWAVPSEPASSQGDPTEPAPSDLSKTAPSRAVPVNRRRIRHSQRTGARRKRRRVGRGEVVAVTRPRISRAGGGNRRRCRAMPASRSGRLPRPWTAAVRCPARTAR